MDIWLLGAVGIWGMVLGVWVGRLWHPGYTVGTGHWELLADNETILTMENCTWTDGEEPHNAS